MKATIQIEPITEATFPVEALAAWLARQSDFVQANFFNQFDTHLRLACQGSGSLSMQCYYISKHLNPDAAYTLKDIGTKD